MNIDMNIDIIALRQKKRVFLSGGNIYDGMTYLALRDKLDSFMALKEFSDIEVFVRREEYGDSYEVGLSGLRDEFPDETKRRVLEERKWDAQKKDSERANYERLKAKFEPTLVGPPKPAPGVNK